MTVQFVLWHWDRWSVHLSQQKAWARRLKAQGAFDVQKQGLLQSCSNSKCFWVESELD